MKKMLLTLGSGVSALAPIATVVACGTTKSSSVIGVNTSGYSKTMTELSSGTIDMGGAWGDARFYAGTSRNKIATMGVEENRIANDGIQAKKDMDSHDLAAIQKLFTFLIGESLTNDELKIDMGGNEKVSLFQVYSHVDYKEARINDQVTYLDAGVAKQKNMITKTPTINNTNGGTIMNAVTGGDYDNIDNFSTKSGQEIKIEFIPSNDATYVTTATNQLSTYLKSKGVNVIITVASDYEAAATKLEQQTIDLAFLPVDTWANNASSSQFILQAARPTQIATLILNGTTVSVPGTKITDQKSAIKLMDRYSQLYLADIPSTIDATWAGEDAYRQNFKDDFETSTSEWNSFARAVHAFANDVSSFDDKLTGSYEAWIYANIDSKLYKDIKEIYDSSDYKDDWKLDISGESYKYGYTSVTSGASYTFPELWIYNHLGQTIKL